MPSPNLNICIRYSVYLYERCQGYRRISDNDNNQKAGPRHLNRIDEWVLWYQWGKCHYTLLAMDDVHVGLFVADKAHVDKAGGGQQV